MSFVWPVLHFLIFLLSPIRCTVPATEAAFARIRLSQLCMQIDLYERNHRRRPTQAEGLQLLVDEGHLRARDLVDPWGRPFHYARSARTGASGVFSGPPFFHHEPCTLGSEYRQTKRD